MDETPYQTALRVVRETIASHKMRLDDRVPEICNGPIRHTGDMVVAALELCPEANKDPECNRLDGAISALKDVELTLGADLVVTDA
jgi:hypothetical protein